MKAHGFLASKPACFRIRKLQLRTDKWSCHKTHSTSAAKLRLKTRQTVSSLSPAKRSRGPKLEGCEHFLRALGSHSWPLLSTWATDTERCQSCQATVIRNHTVCLWKQLTPEGPPCSPPSVVLACVTHFGLSQLQLSAKAQSPGADSREGCHAGIMG